MPFGGSIIHAVDGRRVFIGEVQGIYSQQLNKVFDSCIYCI